MKPPLWLRKLVRPLIPDAVMARYRLHEHSRQVRVNVDVFLPPGDGSRSRWLTTTPDTYRVGRLPEGAAVEFHHVAPGSPGLPDGRDADVLAAGADRSDAELAARLVTAAAVDVGVIAEVPAPRLVARRRVEPTVAPLAVAARRGRWMEAGGLPAGEAPLPGLLERLRDAGNRIGLVPHPPAGAPAARTDPISAPPVLILALVPMHDVGGGSRSAQLARELVRRGYHVTYAALYGTMESRDLGLRYVHPRLEQPRATELDVGRYLQRVDGKTPIVIVEAPTPEFLDPVRRATSAGATVVYDVVDDWSAPSLGGDWYRPEVEDQLAALAEVVTASAPDLVAARQRRGRPAVLVPNGVDAEIFAGDAGPRPPDIPAGAGPVIGYHGSLHGDWFDWDAVAAVAAAYPQARLVVIGDDRVPRPGMPPHVHFLGLKPQIHLPAYLAAMDVGIVPFVVSGVTHAVSPLKAFEYLASGVPVAAPPLRSLAGLDGVHTAKSLPDAVAAALAAPRPDRAAALAAHSWGGRLAEMFRAAGLDLQDAAGPGPTVLVRPATHYRKADREL